MDTMMSFSNNDLASHFMTKDEIKSVCPLAFAKSPTNPGVSQKYITASSETIIDDMEKLGWYPVDAKQKRARHGSIYSYHMIAFQNPEVKIFKTNADGTKVVDAYPRIIMTNSHDGFNSFRFMCACFRLVCSNGLIIATDQMVNIAIRHMNYNFEELRTLVAKAVEAVPAQVKVMNDMKSTMLDEAQKRKLALSMINIRHKQPEGEQPRQVSDSTIKEILDPVREEDKGNDLFTVFNVIQEKMMRGGYHMEAQKSKRISRVRPIKSFAKDLSINKQLFSEAVKYLAAA